MHTIGCMTNAVSGGARGGLVRARGLELLLLLRPPVQKVSGVALGAGCSSTARATRRPSNSSANATPWVAELLWPLEHFVSAA